MTETKNLKKDRRIIILASEVSDARDRKVPGLLLELKDILSSVSTSSGDGKRIRKEVWEYNVLQVLILVLKQDFSLVQGGWQTAAGLATILSQVCSGLDLPLEDRKLFEHKYLPEAVENMFLVARRIQARYGEIPIRSRTEVEREDLYGCFAEVMEAMIYMTSGHTLLASKVIQSPWLLQLLISDNPETVCCVMEFIPKILRINRALFKELDGKVIFSIMDELIYKLSVNSNVKIGAASTKCVLKVCDYHKPMVEVLCTRYKGLRPLLGKWNGKGFAREIKDLFLLLESGNAQKADMERFNRAAVILQAAWKGFHVRKKLGKAEVAFAKFQKSYRSNREVAKRKKEMEKQQQQLQQQLKLNRQHIMREFQEKKLHTIQILPASQVDMYLQNEERNAAVQIQRTWRGHNVRSQMTAKKQLVRQTRAAIKIQRGFRRWLEKSQAKQEEIPKQLRPPGLTDSCRVELQHTINEWREHNPARHVERDKLLDIHKKSAEMLARYYAGLKSSRKHDQHREALLARLETDSELIMLAPSLADVTEKDVEMYSSHSLPVATKARSNHLEELKLLRQPWWKKLDDEFHEPVFEEEEILQF